MIERRGAARARLPFSADALTAVLVGTVLLIGFLLVQTPWGEALFGWIAEGLAVLSNGGLSALGHQMVRNGVEIRDVVADRAITVTSACDGNGLLLGALAAFTWLGVRTRSSKPLWAVIAGGLAVVLTFNLFRIMVLFILLPWPELMLAQHLFVAPLVSALLVGALALAGRGLHLGDLVATPLLWLGIAVLASAAWYVVGESVSCAVEVPLTNLFLAVWPGDLERGIVCSATGAFVETSAAVSTVPLQVLNVPITPSDFSLALPLAVASLTFARSMGAFVKGALLTIGLFALALAFGAATASIDAAVAANVSLLVSSVLRTPFIAPDPTWLALAKAAQNSLVHFNLFVLPLALLQLARPSVSPKPQPAPGRRRATA